MSRPLIVDSHCHLQMLGSGERARALDEARTAGVGGFLVPAIRLDDCEALLAMCDREEDVWCALGMHPHEAAGWTDDYAARLRELLDEPGVIAVGECGLDFHYARAPRSVQVRVFRAQCEIAIDAELPIVVHNRESNDEMRRIVRDPSLGGLGGVFHSFAGGIAMAAEMTELGFHIGLSGMITFPRADNVREVPGQIARSRLLVETDTPYLAPVPHRGMSNRPAFLVQIVERLASELETEYVDVASSTTENFFTLFSRARRG